jgi:Reverse transcriptase (RNA-dependent DNA polymerase)
VMANSSTFVQTDRKVDLPFHIRQQIQTKRKLRTLWQRTRSPETKILLNRQTALVKDLLHTFRESQWENFLGSIDDNSQGWSKIYKLNRRLLRKQPPNHPLADENGSLHFDAETKVGIFADSLANQFKTPTSCSWVDEMVNESIDFHDNQHYIKSMFFSPGEVWNVIKTLPNRCAPGPDRLSNCALKYCCKKIITYINHILNCCLRLEYFPSAWKEAAVILLPKPGKDPKSPQNYRPISLLSNLGKIYERLLLTRLKIALIGKIRPEQYGFRPQHSTTLQLTNVIGEFISNANKRHKTAATLLDIKKAFDKVWHNGLTYKLLAMEVPHQLVNILRSFLISRTFYVKIDNAISNTRQIEAGVPQGSCLSPHLFAVYINDIPMHPNAKIALFADDTIFYSSSKTFSTATKYLQAQIDLSIPWFMQWKITINATKTKAIRFSHRPTRDSERIHFGGTTLKWSRTAKYLGITIDEKLKFNIHAKDTLNKAKGAKFTLFPLLHSRSPLSLKMKLYLYKIYLRPIIAYACPVWSSNISATYWKKLEAFQSSTLRLITGAHYYVSNKTIRNSLQIKSFKDEMMKDAEILRGKIANSHFKHISDIYNRPSAKELFWNNPLNLQ